MAPCSSDLVWPSTGTLAGICGACRSGSSDGACASDLCADEGAAASSTAARSSEKTCEGQDAPFKLCSDLASQSLVSFRRSGPIWACRRWLARLYCRAQVINLLTIANKRLWTCKLPICTSNEVNAHV